MKRKYAIAGLIAALSIVMSSAIVFVAAVSYYPELTSTPGGVVWEFSTLDPGTGEPWFSGKDVDKSTVKAYWWYEGGADQEITPRVIILTKKTVKLVFDPKDLPEYADGNKVIGTLTDGSTDFKAAGPGFLRRKWR